MYSNKLNVQETVALIKSDGIRHVVLSPGSRNAPLIETFSADAHFICHSVVDERSAGFFALGLIQKVQAPVVVCCTSGTALLNYGPAVAEAFYQELPLVVVSADRGQAWIGQMDGQTLPQPGIFGSLVRHSVQLPEIRTEEERWYCNRLVNEALNAATGRVQGPVHINLPISEPLFGFVEGKLPAARRIAAPETQVSVSCPEFEHAFRRSERLMFVWGQQAGNRSRLEVMLSRFASEGSAVVLTEHLNPHSGPDFIWNFDALMAGWDASDETAFVPDLLVTLGGHVVSKRLRKWLRNNPPLQHWHIGTSSPAPDTFQHLTHVLQADPEAFLCSLVHHRQRSGSLDNDLSDSLQRADCDRDWVARWKEASARVPVPERKLPFSDLTATGAFAALLPHHSVVFAGNSSTVRNLQLFQTGAHTLVFCNRGTSGIEGTLSTACGYATASPDETVFVVLGDLSFFYDLNILTYSPFPKNLRILLLNNFGGGIFQLLPGLKAADSLDRFVSASHDRKAEAWVKAAGLRWAGVGAEDDLQQDKHYEQLDAALKTWMKPEGDAAFVLEVFTRKETNIKAFEQYLQQLKNNRHG